MLVCPECRNENPEDSRFCIHCGRSVEPQAGAPVRRPEGERDRELFELPVPKRRSPVPAILGLAVVAVVAGGLWTWSALRPNLCEGKFASDLAPYCLVVPAGWEDRVQEVGGQSADTFAPGTGEAAVIVQSEAVPSRVDALGYADSVKEFLEGRGLFPSPDQRVDVAGTAGTAWDVSETSDTGTTIHQRLVVVLQGGRGWIITFAGNDETFSSHRTAFEQMLETWSWT